jgi:hypothetical protein
MRWGDVTVRRFMQSIQVHVRNFFTNWREYDAPVGTKLRLTMRNRLRATLSREQCCGRPGEPGC